jgi:hypothetical protein
MTMKRRTAQILRRLANRLDPQAQPPQIYITYNGQPVDDVVTETLKRIHRSRRLGAA